MIITIQCSNQQLCIYEAIKYLPNQTQAKMLRTLIALSVVFGLIVADPLPKVSASSSQDVERSFGHGGHHYSNTNSFEEVAPVATSLGADVFTAVVGHKATLALSIAVSAIGWLVSNSIFIIIGSVLTLGFCKLTGKCSLDYQVYEPVAQFRSLVTPERLKTAETFLAKAVEKYSEERKMARKSKKY